MPFAARWMDLEIIILSEVRKRQILYDITYMQKLKNNTNELFTNRSGLTDIENKSMVTKEESWGGTNQECGINRYTTNKIDKQQGFTVEHREQYSKSLITYNGKDSEKDYIYMDLLSTSFT